MTINLFKKEEVKELDDLENIKSQDLEPFKFPEEPTGESSLKTAESEQPEEPEEIEEENDMPSMSLSSKIENKIEELAPELQARPETTIDDFPLKELIGKIDTELRNIKDNLRDLGKLEEITLDSPEMVSLLDLYIYSKSKLQEFTDEINKMDLTTLGAQRTIAAIYKFRACKVLSEIKKQIQRIDDVCRDAGFIPTRIHEILSMKAEDLVNSFLREKPQEKRIEERKAEIKTLRKRIGRR
jgi:hypothetical protein